MSLAAALPAVAAAFAVTLVRIQVRRRLAPVRSAATRAWQPRDLVLALAVVGTALATRLILLEARPIDNDEPVGLGIASLGAWAAETDSRLHPPLPALLMTWLGGATKIEAARSVSVLAGTASAAIAFAMVRGSAGRGPAFLAGLWLALMPAAIHTSQLARGYALCAFGLIAAHACLEKALATGRERWFALYSVAAALALTSEYWALPPLAASATAASWSARRHPTSLVGVIGSLGAALALAAFFAPFALPTLWLGVGGGSHSPTGPLRALSDAIALASGSAAPFNGLVALGLVLAAARRSALGRSELMALAGIVAAVLTFLVASHTTAVRARYLLPVVPLFVCVVAASARGIGVAVLVGIALGHAGLLPWYYAGTARGPELSTGERTPLTLEMLRADPRAPVAVVPAWAIAEASYRLEGRFPDRDAGVGCPATLCVAGRRTIYGAAAGEVADLTRHEGTLYVWLRAGQIPSDESCGVVLREGGSTLLRCDARTTGGD